MSKAEMINNFQLGSDTTHKWSSNVIMQILKKTMSPMKKWGGWQGANVSILHLLYGYLSGTGKFISCL